MSLLKLPEHIIQSILSGSTPIYSYKRAVEELVYNSIDADASSIAIRIDIDQNTIQVIDNGNGIPNQDFMLLGERYATSKFVNLSSLKSASNQYGYQGQSLASIIEVSKSLKISSRHGGDTRTWMKSFVKGLKSNISKIDRRPSKGTTVDIKGFLFNHNIQKKTVNPIIEIHDIKKFLEKLALIHNSISLSLRDDRLNQIIFKLHKNRDLYQTLSSLFGITKAEVQEYKVEKNQYKVTAVIGKPNNEMSYHWIYLNGRYLSVSKLHNDINSGMKKYLNSNVAQKIIKYLNNFNQDNEEIEKKLPYYFIFISCPYYDYDVIINNKKTVVEFKNWDQINKLLDKLIKFYNGNMNLKEIKVNDAKPIKKHSPKNKEVEKIIKKILGSNKKPNITQLQNGVKGKIVKRKLKKYVPKLSLSKVIPKKINVDIEKDDVKDDENSIKSIKISDSVFDSDKATKEDILTPKKDKTIIVTKEMCMKPKINLKRNIISRYREQNKVHKTKIKNTSLNKKKSKLKVNKNFPYRAIEKFHNETESVSRKCNMLSKTVQELMNCKDGKKTARFIEQTDKLYNISENNNKVAVAVTYQKNERFGCVYNSKEPNNEICTFDNRVWKNKKNSTKSTYDLIQTIIKSQQQSNKEQLETLYSIKKSSKMNYGIETETYKYTYSNVDPEVRGLKKFVENSVFPSHTAFELTPKELDFYKLTYQSHNYNKSAMTTDSHLTYFSELSYSPKVNQFHFITEQSRENFIEPKERANFRNKMNFSRKNIYTYKKPYSKLDNLRKTQETFSNNVHKLITLDFTKSNNNRSNNPNIDGASHKTTTYTIDSETDNTEIFRVNSQINSTYTIISNSIYVSHDSFTEANKKLSPHVINERALQTNDYSNNQVLENPSINYGDVDKEANVFHLSQKQNKDLIDNVNIEPLEFCQTIMQSSESQKEFRNRRNDSLFADDFSIDSELCDRNIYSSNKQNLNPDCFVRTNNNIQDHNDQNDIAVEINDEVVSKTNGIDMQEDKIISDRSDCKETDYFQFKNRLRFVPKGMSQIFQNSKTKIACNYHLDEEYFEQDIYKTFINDVQKNSEVFQPVIQSVQEQTSKAIEKVNQKLNKDSASLTFDSESLKSVTVLGQVDQKFIAATIESKSTNKQQMFLVLFDQHAVHERIRLENNLSDYVQQDQWKTLPLNLSIQLNREDILFLHNYRNKFNQLGLHWTVSNHDFTITAIPEAILGKNPRPVDVVMKTVKKLISEEINIIRTQKGCITLYPKAIMDLVFSEACRYAIKFGEKLSKNDCIELLKSLSDCKTPFQCAHGRPVMAVLMDWRSEQRGYQTNATKIEEFVKRRCS